MRDWDGLGCLLSAALIGIPLLLFVTHPSSPASLGLRPALTATAPPPTAAPWPCQDEKDYYKQHPDDLSAWDMYDQCAHDEQLKAERSAPDAPIDTDDWPSNQECTRAGCVDVP